MPPSAGMSASGSSITLPLQPVRRGPPLQPVAVDDARPVVLGARIVGLRHAFLPLARGQQLVRVGIEVAAGHPHRLEALGRFGGRVDEHPAVGRPVGDVVGAAAHRRLLEAVAVGRARVAQRGAAVRREGAVQDVVVAVVPGEYVVQPAAALHRRVGADQRLRLAGRLDRQAYPDRRVEQLVAAVAGDPPVARMDLLPID